MIGESVYLLGGMNGDTASRTVERARSAWSTFTAARRATSTWRAE